MTRIQPAAWFLFRVVAILAILALVGTLDANMGDI